MGAIRPISFTIKNSNCAKNNFDYRLKIYIISPLSLIIFAMLSDVKHHYPNPHLVILAQTAHFREMRIILGTSRHSKDVPFANEFW